MAMESACTLRVGRDRFEGKVRLDGDYIDFAGQTKFRFRLAEIRRPRRESDAIRFDFHGTDVAIRMDEKTSARWIESIMNPESLADKLGVKDGQAVRVMNLDDIELMGSLREKSVKMVSAPPARCDMVMLGVERAAELRQIGDLSETLRPGGAIWVVLPKSVRTVTKANVVTAAREAGLNNVKAIDYSETQAAYKITRPNGMRRKRKSTGDDSPDSASRGRRTTTRGGGNVATAKAR